MPPIATDGVVWSVCLSVTTVSPAKADEPIVMPFGVCNPVGPRNHALDSGQDPHARQFWGKKGPVKDMPGHVRRSIYLKRLSRGQNRYGADADWGVLYGVHIGETWRIRLNRPAMRPSVKLL